MGGVNRNYGEVREFGGIVWEVVGRCLVGLGEVLGGIWDVFGEVVGRFLGC